MDSAIFKPNLNVHHIKKNCVLSMVIVTNYQMLTLDRGYFD